MWKSRYDREIWNFVLRLRDVRCLEISSLRYRSNCRRIGVQVSLKLRYLKLLYKLERENICRRKIGSDFTIFYENPNFW